jgi:hypothetical protein
MWRTQFSWVLRQDPRVMGPASNPILLGPALGPKANGSCGGPNSLGLLISKILLLWVIIIIFYPMLMGHAGDPILMGPV